VLKVDREPDTVLVVEDDASSRKLIRTILASRGYRVAEAADIPQAQAFLARNLPSLVLLDLRLEGDDGLDLMRDIRADPRTRDLPVAAVTAQAMQDDESRVLAAGCDAYLTKPIDTRRLPQVVAELIAKRRAHGHAE